MSRAAVLPNLLCAYAPLLRPLFLGGASAKPKLFQEPALLSTPLRTDGLRYSPIVLMRHDLKNNSPRYVVLDFAAVDSSETVSDEEALRVAREFMSQDAPVYEALAK